MPSKRASSLLFSAIDQLNTDDQTAAKKRKKVALKSVSKSKAARSQNELFTNLMETRILLQRAIFASAPTVEEGDKPNQEAKGSNNKIFLDLVTARNKLAYLGDEYDTSDEEYMLQKSYEKCREQWKAVLDKRHSDLQIHAGLTIKSSKKFQTIDQSFWTQVTSAVSHDRIMRQANTNKEDITEKDSSPPVYSLFQDDKLYQHMLKDFITLSSSTGNSNQDASQRLLKAMKKSKKNHKQVDRKASKGRKIRYTVHPKLTNFTFPINRPIPSIDENDWFKSLFGGSTQSKTKKYNL